MGLLGKIFGNNGHHKTGKVDYVAVATGTLMSVTASADPVFAQKMMGDGYLIIPSEDTIVAPVAGTIKTIFPTLHAITILADNGDEVVIHVGLDTVKLQGDGFQVFVKEGDHVEVGDHLLEVDFASIKDKVPSIGIPVVVTNIGMRRVKLVKKALVQANDVAMTIG